MGSLLVLTTQKNFPLTHTPRPKCVRAPLFRSLGPRRFPMESHPRRRELLTQDMASAILQSSEHRQLEGWVPWVGCPRKGRTQPFVTCEPQS